MLCVSYFVLDWATIIVVLARIFLSRLTFQVMMDFSSSRDSDSTLTMKS